MAELQLALPARCYTTRSWILNIDLNKKLFVDIHTLIYLSYYPMAKEMENGTGVYSEPIWNDLHRVALNDGSGKMGWRFVDIELTY